MKINLAKVGDKVKILCTTTADCNYVNQINHLKCLNGVIGTVIATYGSDYMWDYTISNSFRRTGVVSESYFYRYWQVAYFMIID